MRIRRFQWFKLFKFTSSVQMFVSSPFRPPLLFPESVSALVKVLFLRKLPMLGGPPLGAPLLLPQCVGALSNDLVQARLRLGAGVSIIGIRRQRAAPANVHSGSQATNLVIWHQFLEYPRFQRFLFILRIQIARAFDPNRKDMS